MKGQFLCIVWASFYFYKEALAFGFMKAWQEYFYNENLLMWSRHMQALEIVLPNKIDDVDEETVLFTDKVH